MANLLAYKKCFPEEDSQAVVPICFTCRAAFDRQRIPDACIVSRNGHKDGLGRCRRHVERADSQSLGTNRRRLTLGISEPTKDYHQGHGDNGEMLQGLQ